MSSKEHKSLLGNSLWIFFIKFFGTIASLLVIVYFSHNLDRPHYGQYQNFWVRLLVLSTIACGGISVLVYTYAPSTIRSILKRVKARHYAMYGLFLTGMAFVFLLLNQFTFTSLPEAGWAAVTLIFFIAYVLNIILEALLAVYHKFRYLFITGIAYATLFVGIHWKIANDGFALKPLISYLALLITVKLILNISAAVHAVKAIDAADSDIIHTRRIKSMWAHTFFYDTSQIVFRYLDKFIVSYLVTRELSATYFNGTIDIPFLPLILSAVSSAALMQLTGSKGGNKELTVETIRRSSSLLATVTFPAFFFLLFFREEFIVLFFSEKYLASISIFVCSLIRLPFYVINVPFYLQYKQKGNIINKGALLDMVLTLLLVYPMYTWLGLEGIVLSFVISSYVQLFYYTFWTSALLRTPVSRFLPIKDWLIKMLLFGTITLCLHAFLAQILPLNTRFILGGAVIGGLTCLWVYYEYKRSGIVNFASNK